MNYEYFEYSVNLGGTTRQRLYIDKDAGAFLKGAYRMDIFYKKIKANVTPEVLAQLHSKKIILESANQQQTKVAIQLLFLIFMAL